MSVLKSSSFKKLMRYAIPFKSKLFSVAFWAIFLAIVAGIRPLILNITIGFMQVKMMESHGLCFANFLTESMYIIEGNVITLDLIAKVSWRSMLQKTLSF